MRIFLPGFLGLVLAGCRSPPAPPAGTGAREAAQHFFDALVQQDWSRAYAVLDPEWRAYLHEDSFVRLAQTYRKQLGFEPSTVHVRSCEEHGPEAIAHVVLTAPGGQKRHKDALVLRRNPSGWGVMLSARFGHS